MTDPLSRIFFALADPTRRAILARLANGEASVGELAEPFSMTAPAMTKHLKVLERAGLITRTGDAQWRRCRLDASGLRDVAEWVDYYRKHWDESLDRLEFFCDFKRIRRESGYDSMKGGFGGTLDQLEAYLQTLAIKK